jgi:hypothetical protein
MRRKSNNKRIEEQLDEALTIQQLIDHLKTMPPDTYVGKVGHFGEANLMDKYDLPIISRAYITPSGLWRDGHEHTIEMLDFCVPDIGPDPD